MSRAVKLIQFGASRRVHNAVNFGGGVFVRESIGRDGMRNIGEWEVFLYGKANWSTEEALPAARRWVQENKGKGPSEVSL